MGLGRKKHQRKRAPYHCRQKDQDCSKCSCVGSCKIKELCTCDRLTEYCRKCNGSKWRHPKGHSQSYISPERKKQADYQQQQVADNGW